MTEVKPRSLLSKILLFAGILGLPAFFIFMLSLGKQRFESLKYYGDHKIITKVIDGKEVNDTIHYRVPAFEFIDHNGNRITEKDFDNKILVVNYIYGDCPSDFCPIDFKNFKMFVADEIDKNDGFKDVEIISLFEGVQDDTLAEMNKFIKYFEINPTKWHLVQGDMAQFYNTDMLTQNPWMAKDSLFGLDKVAYNMTILIDRDLHIRGKYITSQTSENKRITKEISILLREENDSSNEK
jgi:protein SCO1/2